MKKNVMMKQLAAAVLFAIPAHAQLLVVNPTKMNADWETGHWTSGYTEFSELKANFQMTTGPLSQDYADREDFLTFYATNEFARSGDYSVRFYSEPQPTNPQPYRTEIECAGSLTHRLGDELYYSASFRPGANWATGSLPSHWTTVIIQWKIYTWGPPPLGLIMSNDGLHNVSIKGTSLGTLPVDEWTDFVFFIKWSASSDGVIRVWKNGELVYEFFGITWEPGHLTGGYLQMGQYTQLHYEPRTMHIDNVRIGDSMFTNQLPEFVTDPISAAKGIETLAYAGTIAGSATDPDGNSLTYAKVAGPAWLNVASDGTLSGTPGPGDVGANVFTVRAADDHFGEDTTTLNIKVISYLPIPVTSSDFQSNSWSGGTGWSGDWAFTTGSGAPEIDLLAGNYCVKLTRGDLNHSITRTLASPVSDGTLTFKWDVDSLDNPAEYAYAEVFDGTWHTVWSMNSSGNGTDLKPTPDNLQEASVDLRAYGAVTQMRFSMSNTASSGDYFYLDDIELLIYVDSHYETWRLGYSLSDEDAAYLADPDDDGMDNLYEFAIGSVPTNGTDAATLIPALGNFTGATFEYIHRRRIDYDELGMDCWVERTTNLVDGVWTTNGVSISGITPAETGFETIINEIPLDSEPEQFVRLRIDI